MRVYLMASQLRSLSLRQVRWLQLIRYLVLVMFCHQVTKILWSGLANAAMMRVIVCLFFFALAHSIIHSTIHVHFHTYTQIYIHSPIHTTHLPWFLHLFICSLIDIDRLSFAGVVHSLLMAKWWFCSNLRGKERRTHDLVSISHWLTNLQ